MALAENKDLQQRVQKKRWQEYRDFIGPPFHSRPNVTNSQMVRPCGIEPQSQPSQGYALSIELWALSLEYSCPPFFFQENCTFPPSLLASG